MEQASRGKPPPRCMSTPTDLQSARRRAGSPVTVNPWFRRTARLDCESPFVTSISPLFRERRAWSELARSSGRFHSRHLLESLRPHFAFRSRKPLPREQPPAGRKLQRGRSMVRTEVPPRGAIVFSPSWVRINEKTGGQKRVPEPLTLTLKDS